MSQRIRVLSWVLLLILPAVLPADTNQFSSVERVRKLGIEEIVFAAREEVGDGHWYANFGYYAHDRNAKLYKAGGRLCVLDLKTGHVRLLVDDPQGSVRDPVVHYDAGKVLFSWRKQRAETYHLYEINIDGEGLKQITDGEYDDIEATYLPDGGIVFVSSRCKRWVNCWLSPVATLYRCDADGNNIHQLSANIEHDNTPWVLPDGRILYQRWEYIDRSQVHYHHLWSANPDGTGQMVFFGNMHPGSVFIDAKPIPGSDQVVLIDSPGHGRKEHAGFVATVTDQYGPDEKAAMQRISRQGNYRDPYPLSTNALLVANGRKLLLMDLKGKTKDLYAIPAEWGKATLHEPRPVVHRPRERVIPPRVDRSKSTGTLVLNDVYFGRNMKGVERGEIKTLLVLEALPKPINYTGGMDPLTYGGSFTLERILGTVPVEPDGSAFMELPANRALFFVALDEKNNSVKRMQSFLTVMPGETVSCTGCHEPRGQAPAHRGAVTKLQALQRPASSPRPVAHVPQVFDFPRDIQPILDKHCVRCHSVDAGRSGVILSGDRGPMYSHSYITLTLLRQFVDGRNNPKSNLPPRSIGTSASPIMKKLDGTHPASAPEAERVRLSAREKDMLRYWIESAAVYPGTYAALGGGCIGGYAQNKQVHRDHDWPTVGGYRETVNQRCIACHKEKLHLPLPRTLCDEQGISFWRPHMGDRRHRFSRHLAINLSRPEKSLMLLGPLAKEAGGLGSCTNDAGQAVFADTSDQGYQKMLAHITVGQAYLEKITRFDMPQFRPPAPYVREMKKYGVLPKDVDAQKAQLDVYEIDRKYWDLVWGEALRGEKTGNIEH